MTTPRVVGLGFGPSPSHYVESTTGVAGIYGAHVLGAPFASTVFGNAWYKFLASIGTFGAIGTFGGGAFSWMYSDVGVPTLTTMFGTGNSSTTGRALLSPTGKRIIVDGTTSTVGNYHHVASLAAARAAYAVGDWILVPGGGSLNQNAFNAATSITSSGTTATVFTANTTGIVVNQPIGVRGCTGPNAWAFNRGGTCLSLTANTSFTYQIPDVANASAAGSPTWAVGFGELYTGTIPFSGTDAAHMSVVGTYDPAHNTDSVGDEQYYNTLRYTVDVTGIGSIAGCNALYANHRPVQWFALCNFNIVCSATDKAQFSLAGSTASNSNSILIENCLFNGIYVQTQGANPSGTVEQIAISSITSVGTTATAFTANTTYLSNGMNLGVIGCTGATAANYNVFGPISNVVTGVSFDYTITSTGGVSATGTPTWTLDVADIPDAFFMKDICFRYCGFMYANSSTSGRTGNQFANMVERYRVERCFNFHGGWDKGMLRNTGAWGDAGFTLSSLTSSGTTATAATTHASLWAIGETVTINGAVQPEYNGAYVVTGVTPGTSFTYTFAGSGTSPATGTITCGAYCGGFPVSAGGLTSSGTTATFNNASASSTFVVGDTVEISGVAAAQGEYNGRYAVTGVNAGVSITYTFAGTSGVTATGSPVISRPGAPGPGPDIFKHGMYLSNQLNDVQVMDTVTGWDASNLKFTGQAYQIQNLVTIRSPMGFIFSSQGNDQWNSGMVGSTILCDNLLQVEADDVNWITGGGTAGARGWGPEILAPAVGSYIDKTVLLNQSNLLTSNHLGIVAVNNGFTFYNGVITVSNSVIANWAGQTSTANPDGTTTITYSNNVWPIASVGSNTILTSMPSAYQTNVTNALAKNIHTTFRASDARFSGVTVGATDLATEENMMAFMCSNIVPDGLGAAPNLWCSMIQYHYRAPLAGR